MDIRFATVEDLDNVIAVNTHLQKFKKENIAKKIPREEIIVAEIDQQIVGVATFEYIWTTRPYLDSIFVDPEFRRQKVGSQLLAYLEQFLASRGYRYLYSSTEEDAEIAKNWHLQNGFTLSGALDGLNLPNPVREVFFFKELGVSALK